MADNKWTNDKGVTLVGQTSSVPAPDFKAPTVVEYSELHSAEVVMTPASAPTQAANGSAQTVSISALVASDARSPIPTWDYDLSFSGETGDVPLTIQNVTSAPPSGSLQAVFPIGVTTGQVGIIRANSGGAIGILKITVL